MTDRRSILILSSLLAVWLVWIIGIVPYKSSFFIFGVAFSNFVGAYSLYRLSQMFPMNLRVPLRLVMYGLLFVGVADSYHAYLLNMTVSTPKSVNYSGLVDYSNLFSVVRELLFIIGGILVAVGATSIPLRLEKIKLHPKGHSVRIITLATLAGVGLVLIVGILIRSCTVGLIFCSVQSGYLFLSTFLTVLLAAETRTLTTRGFKVSLRNIALAVTSICLAKLIGILMGYERTHLSETIYGALWLISMTILGLTGAMIKRRRY